MNVTKYTVKRDMEVLDELFLKDEVIYITGSFRVMDGNMGYGMKVFNHDREFLGTISVQWFERYIESSLEKH